MLRMIVMTAVFLAPQAAWAKSVKLAAAEITAVLSDQSLYAGEQGEIEQIFQKSGQTFYLDHGNSSQGTWKVENDKYCSQWPPSQSWSCYDVIRDSDAITFVSGTGKSFPMRIHN
jgi:hypothetical protein